MRRRSTIWSERHGRHAVLQLFLLVTFVGLVSCGDDGTPAVGVDAPDELGRFAVGHASFSAVDSARQDRELLVDIWYPVQPGDEVGAPPTQYPLAAGIGLDSEVAFEGPPASPRTGQKLVVFSHGYGGIRTQSVELMEALASHGFVVIAPEHTGNSQTSSTDDFDQAASRRVPDVSFLIDTMIARNRDPADALYERIDEARIGVIGHSFGGMTALGMAAGWAGASPDPRVAAIVPISAVIDGDLQQDTRTGPNAGFSRAQLETVVVPTMLIGGTADVGVPIGNNAIAFDQLISAPRVYKVDIHGANHTHFANVCAIGDLLISLGLGRDAWPSLGAEALLEPYAATCTPDAFAITEASRLTNLYAVSFFKRHLDHQAAYDRYLTTTYASTEPAITFDVR